MIRCVQRLAGSGSIIGRDAARCIVVCPETNRERLKGVKEPPSESAAFGRENNNSSVRKKTVAVGLFKRFSPVSQFELKRPDDRIRLESKCFRRNKIGLAPSVRLPVDGDKIRNSVAV